MHENIEGVCGDVLVFSGKLCVEHFGLLDRENNMYVKRFLDIFTPQFLNYNFAEKCRLSSKPTE
ncbi:MAG: hypothetical protein Q3974_06130 [Rothia sp. (in: high G+C Gram-positive bacteria)]|nr:hypothetical protein [Rothia sp. (in: high G+C Gram-positive bacteria)]